MRRGGTAVLFALFSGALAWGAPAPAPCEQYLTAASGLYERLDYERALEELQRAKKFSRGPADDGRIALYEGVVLSDLGRAEEGQAAFRTALFLNPNATLPIRVSPKVAQIFERCRAQVTSDLARHPRDTPAATVAGAPTLASPTPWYWLPLGVAAAAGIAAGGCAVVSKQDYDALTTTQGAALTPAQWQSAANNGKTLQTVALVGAGVAAAGVVTAVLLSLTRSPAGPPVTAGLALGPTGGALTVSGAFP